MSMSNIKSLSWFACREYFVFSESKNELTSKNRWTFGLVTAFGESTLTLYEFGDFGLFGLYSRSCSDIIKARCSNLDWSSPKTFVWSAVRSSRNCKRRFCKIFLESSFRWIALNRRRTSFVVRSSRSTTDASQPHLPTLNINA